jgi:hypothetical protein
MGWVIPSSPEYLYERGGDGSVSFSTSKLGTGPRRVLKPMPGFDKLISHSSKRVFWARLIQSLYVREGLQYVQYCTVTIMRSGVCGRPGFG